MRSTVNTLCDLGDAMFCPHCGTRLPEDGRFCPICGERLDAPFTPPTQSSAETNVQHPTAEDAASARPQKAPAMSFAKKLAYVLSSLAITIVVGGLVISRWLPAAPEGAPASASTGVSAVMGL